MQAQKEGFVDLPLKQKYNKIKKLKVEKKKKTKKKKKKGPGSLTDTENKTHQKKKVCAGLGNARKLPRQMDR